jgi:hypothetical protein
VRICFYIIYIYVTCVNKKYIPHLDKVEKNLITNRDVSSIFLIRIDHLQTLDSKWWINYIARSYGPHMLVQIKLWLKFKCLKPFKTWLKFKYWFKFKFWLKFEFRLKQFTKVQATLLHLISFYSSSNWQHRHLKFKSSTCSLCSQLASPTCS